jgi:hypothetical protein
MKKQGWALNVKAIALAAAFAASTCCYAAAADMPVKAPPPPKAVPFFFVNDTSVSFTYFPNATDPGVTGANHLNQYNGELDHFDVWQYGTNLLVASFSIYSNGAPDQGQLGAQGEHEFFGLWRSTIGLNEVTNSKMFSNFLFTDVGIEVGGNSDVTTDFLSAQDTAAVAGLNFNLNLPGTVLVSILAYKDYAHNEFDACNANFGDGFPGISPCAAGTAAFNGDRYFKVAPAIEASVAEPLTFLPWPVTFHDNVGVYFPKGTGVSAANTFALAGAGAAAQLAQLQNEETKTEVNEDVRLTLDSGKVFWGKPGIWENYVGYKYWYNKFGTDHNAPLFATLAPSTNIESSVYVGGTYHFK